MQCPATTVIGKHNHKYHCTLGTDHEGGHNFEIKFSGGSYTHKNH